MNVIQGAKVRLRSATEGDVEELVRIRATPEVRARWHGEDLASIDADVRESLADDGLHMLIVEDGDGSVIGSIQWAAEDDPDYHHANVDLFLDPAVHGNGFGTDAARTLCRHLIDVEGFHRLTIDPAADNTAAIRCYEKVGFRPIGIMRQYERGVDGTWHDGLLMDLLAGEIAPGP